MARATIFVSVGDDSGDLHGSNLMGEIRALEPDVQFVGLGLRRMIEAGLEPLEAADARGSAMGMHNALRMLEHRRRREMCRNSFQRRRPDLVLLVDYGGFNLYLARMATRAGIPVLYYILPQVWAHGRYRLKKIRKWVTKALVIYPFEAELYRRYGVEAQYVGHPLFDELARRPPNEQGVEEVHRELGEDLVALFPGSRRHEVEANLPVMLKAAGRIQRRLPSVRFASVCSERMRALVDVMLRRSEVEVALPGLRPVELARAARLCITKSGTITLEIASQLRPMVILYRLNAFMYFFSRGIGQTLYFGLVNALAGRMICPEKVLWKDEWRWVEQRALDLLTGPGRYEQCRRELEGVMCDFARPGASQRAARIVVDMVRAGR